MSVTNILYISYDGMTDPLGQSQVLPYITGLSRQGYGFTLISCEKPARYRQHKDKIAAICEAAGIDWQPVPYTAKPPVLSTVKDIRNIRTLALRLHGQKQFAMVHCRSYIPSLIGLELQRRFGLRFLFDMRGFWADERVDGNLWRLGNPLYRQVYNYFKRKEKAFLNQADGIVSLTENGKKEILRWKGIDPAIEIDVIPCCVDMELFDPATLDAGRLATLKSPFAGRYVLGYFGSIGTWYMLDEMLDFFACLKRKMPQSLLMIITPDDPELILRAAAARHIAAENMFIQSAQRGEMPYYIAAADASLFFIKPAFSKISSSPTKHGEIMSMGVPVVCNDRVGDMDHILEASGSGVLVKAFNDAAYTAAIEALQHRQFDTAAIRDSCRQYYSLEEGIKKYAALYSRILA